MLIDNLIKGTNISPDAISILGAISSLVSLRNALTYNKDNPINTTEDFIKLIDYQIVNISKNILRLL